MVCSRCGMLLHLDGTDLVRMNLAKILGLDYRATVDAMGPTPMYRYWCESCGREETEIERPIPRPIEKGELGTLPWKLNR